MVKIAITFGLFKRESKFLLGYCIILDIHIL